MNYYKSDIVLQEVPDEISLCFSICGCPLRCEGCHSPFLWKANNGTELSETIFCHELNKYKDLITCVLFMGGEWAPEKLVALLKIARERNLKTCLYTGLTQIDPTIKKQLTYLKTGPWIAARGGLESPETNQVFTEVKSTKNLTHLFKKRSYDTINN